MAKIVTHTPRSFESFNIEIMAQCISTVHSALQSSAVSAVNRYLTIRNWLIGLYIVEYEQCGNDRAEYGAKLLRNIAERVKIRGINTTLLANARKFYLYYPQIINVAAPIFPMLSEKLKDFPIQFKLPTISAIGNSPVYSKRYTHG